MIKVNHGEKYYVVQVTENGYRVEEYKSYFASLKDAEYVKDRIESSHPHLKVHIDEYTWVAPSLSVYSSYEEYLQPRNVKQNILALYESVSDPFLRKLIIDEVSSSVK